MIYIGDYKPQSYKKSKDKLERAELTIFEQLSILPTPPLYVDVVKHKKSAT